MLAEAMRVGEVIAGKGRLSVMAVKEAVKMCTLPVLIRTRAVPRS